MEERVTRHKRFTTVRCKLLPQQPHVFEGGLPDGDGVAVERAYGFPRRHVNDNRADILRVEERHEVDGVQIGGERLVPAIKSWVVCQTKAVYSSLYSHRNRSRQEAALYL
jgi:hypothetical protein